MSETNGALARGFFFFWGGAYTLMTEEEIWGVHKCRDKPTPSGMGFERTEIFQTSKYLVCVKSCVKVFFPRPFNCFLIFLKKGNQWKSFLGGSQS